MAGIRYTPNLPGVSALMNGPEVQAILRQVALKGAEYARSIAPVRTTQLKRQPPPGDYKEHFSVQVRAHGGVHGDRAEAKIVNDSGHATAVEWVDGYHVLNRTAAHLGSL